MKRTEWFERKFQAITDHGLLPGIIERLEGTPLRLQEKTASLSPSLLESKSGDKWSVKKEIGHLDDLEPLWLERVRQIRAGSAELMVADLSNTRTHLADHDERDIADLLAAFESSRRQLVSELRSLNKHDLEKFAIHPRLQTPMSIVELAYFVAEHDDHHLAQISSLINSSGS